MSDVVIRFAKHQKLPYGYRVEWWESNEMYQWVKAEFSEFPENPNTYGLAFCNRWSAYRNAWAHFKLTNEVDHE